MVASVTFKSNSKEVITGIKNYQKKLTRNITKGLKQAGFQLLDIIRTKTKRGVDYNDKSFYPYSKGYLDHLAKKGYPTKVDLFYSGRMLGSLNPNTSIKHIGKYTVSIGFTNSEMRKRAVFVQVLAKNKREFFGFNNQTERVIGNSFNKFIIKQMRRV